MVFIKFVTMLLLCLVFACTACGILVPRPEIKPVPPALECQVFTTRPPVKSLKNFLHSIPSQSGNQKLWNSDLIPSMVTAVLTCVHLLFLLLGILPVICPRCSLLLDLCQSSEFPDHRILNSTPFPFHAVSFARFFPYLA